jgi:hypothetical protein
MARTVQQGLDEFLQRLRPSRAERESATAHRTSIKGAIEKHLDAVAVWETGSFAHGTAIRGHTDIDLLVSFSSTKKPKNGSSALESARTALRKRYAFTDVVVRSPAVVVRFADGQRVEVIPGFIRSTSGKYTTYDIPQPGSAGWMVSSPRAHLAYVTAANESPSGGAKSLARLLKAWKYYQDVPISSFYLEMRAAQRMQSESSFLPLHDLVYMFRDLSRHALAAMNDPMDVSRRITPCSSSATLEMAKSKLATATGRADKALAAYGKERHAEAFQYLNLLYRGRFPAHRTA